MRITSIKGDSGYTSLLRGVRVPKYHVVTEALGTLGEANSLLGLARASSKEKRVKRIILQVQKQLFTIGAELSVPKGGGKPPKKTISETDTKWLERIIEEFEEALALPPGFVAFGQEETSSQMDAARTIVRKAERMVVKMKSEGMIQNPHILKYLNRLSDLIFVLACFEEKDEEERKKLRRLLTSSQLSDPTFRKWAIFIGSIILVLITAIILLLLFHRPASEKPPPLLKEHMKGMENMHEPSKTDR
jgi:cob(I)alamin adenosyltransferase